MAQVKTDSQTDSQTPVLQVLEADHMIPAAALAAHATHLLTGDKKHFGRYFDDPSRTGGVTIQTVRAFFSDRF